LSGENTGGPGYAVSPERRAILGARLSAALEHAYLLTFHPRDAGPAAIQGLQNTGWSNTGIVILSQIIAFVSYQARLAWGLGILNQAEGQGHG
jgi:uncharacterized protein YciW